MLADNLVTEGGKIAFVLPATGMSGSSWNGIRQLLATKYDVEIVISSHDPENPCMSYDTDMAEVLVVARKSKKNGRVSGRARFVNLRKRPNSETEALAVANAIRRQNRASILSIDQPPVGGSSLMLGNDEWGVSVEAPIDKLTWLGARWLNAECSRFAYSLKNGILWNVDASQHVANLSIRPMEEVYEISPHHRQIRSSSSPFDISESWRVGIKFPALWHYSEDVQDGLTAQPNAALLLKAGREHMNVWQHAGTLHTTPDVRSTSQPIAAVLTENPTLGVRSWFTLRVIGDTVPFKFNREIAASLWLNSTFGLLFHASYSVRSQLGRSTAGRTTLRSLPTLDVRQLQDWQLDAAESVFRDIRDVRFRPFYMCVVDENRINLDERLVREVLGLGDAAVKAVARIRMLLAQEPSIYGNNQPAR